MITLAAALTLAVAVVEMLAGSLMAQTGSRVKTPASRTGSGSTPSSCLR